MTAAQDFDSWEKRNYKPCLGIAFLLGAPKASFQTQPRKGDPRNRDWSVGKSRCAGCACCSFVYSISEWWGGVRGQELFGWDLKDECEFTRQKQEGKGVGSRGNSMYEGRGKGGGWQVGPTGSSPLSSASSDLGREQLWEIRGAG